MEALRLWEDLDRFDADGDGDQLRDGEEVAGHVPPNATGTLGEALDAAPVFRSSALTRDIDDDNRLDGFDTRVWVEDEYPTLRRLEGLGGDLRDGIRFRLTDNHGIVRDSVLVKVYDAGGEAHVVEHQHVADGDRYRVAWPGDVEVHGFNVTVEDVNGNGVSWNVSLVEEDGQVQNAIAEVQGMYVRTMGPGSGQETIFLASILQGAQFNPVVGGILLAVAGGAMILHESHKGDTHDARPVSRVRPDTEEAEPPSPVVKDLEDDASYHLGSVTVDGVELDLHRGDARSGWTRIHNEHPDVDAWSTPQEFLAWVASVADGDDAVQVIDRDMQVVTLKGLGGFVLITAVGGVISDVDVWNPAKNWLPGPVMMQELLGAYVEMMAAAEGPDWLEGYPPVFPVVAPEPVEREGGKEHCEEVGSLNVWTINGKAGPGALRDGKLQATGCLKEAIRLMDAVFDPVARNVVETSLANAAIDAVRGSARFSQEATARWYWGSRDGVPPCDTPEEEQRRRCDELAGTGLADTSDDSKRWFTTWDTTGRQDVLSATGLLLGNPVLEAGGPSWAGLLCKAEQAFDVVQGDYAAKVPSALHFNDGVVYLEWAKTAEDFNYRGGC